MEVPNGDRHMLAVIITEFFGMIFFTLAFNMNGNEGKVMLPLVLYTLILITGGISGGHMNPAVTMANYIEQKKFGSNFCYLILIIVAQVLGSFCAIMVGFLCRVTVQDPTRPGELIWVPGQNPFYPKIIDEVQGLPAYGQVLFAEVFGTMGVCLVILRVKEECRNNPTRSFDACIAIPIAYYAFGSMFANVSGGILNPGLVIAGICWQSMTYKYDPHTTWSMWTNEYSAIYIIGPLLGGFFAGHVFNILRNVTNKMRSEQADDSSEEEPLAQRFTSLANFKKGDRDVTDQDNLDTDRPLKDVHTQ